MKILCNVELTFLVVAAFIVSKNGGLSLPLVKRTDDLGPLPRSFSILNLLPTDRYSIPAQKLSRPIRDGY
uniref:Secreted protein n=1 Tax=Romanomermis culicivorax TaxID=13658 RepID=A0A915HK69_ROMCU